MGCGGSSQEELPKDQWYWMDEYCWKDFILYKSWMENGVCRYEILNNMLEHDILLTVNATDGNNYEEEISYEIKAGKSTGVIKTDKKIVISLDIISVIKIEKGVPTTILECEKKY